MRTLFGIYRGHYFSPRLGSIADDPTLEISPQGKALLYRKEHIAKLLQDGLSGAQRIASRKQNNERENPQSRPQWNFRY